MLKLNLVLPAGSDYEHYYSQTPIMQPPIKRPSPVKRPVIKVSNLLPYNTVDKTPIKRPGPSFGGPDEGLPIVFTPIKRPPKI